jgi:hypothetical protein
MKSKIGAILLALALLGFGAHMLFVPSEYANMQEARISGRNAALKRAFAWVVDTIGAVPTGLILVAGGGVIGFMVVRPKPTSDPTAEM